MLVALSDTHRQDDPGLTPHLETVLEDAERVVHAGDFTTEQVYSAFEALSADLVAVAGNRDSPQLSERLPAVGKTEWAGQQVVVTHGHRHDSTALSLLARQESADIVLTGHTHRPAIEKRDERLLVNPGSHAQPRGNQAAYACFEKRGNRIGVELRTPTGQLVARDTV